MGCHALLQGIFLTQGWNPHLFCLLHWQVGFLPLAPAGKPFPQHNTHLSLHIFPQHPLYSLYCYSFFCREYGEAWSLNHFPPPYHLPHISFSFKTAEHFKKFWRKWWNWVFSTWLPIIATWPSPKVPRVAFSSISKHRVLNQTHQVPPALTSYWTDYLAFSSSWSLLSYFPFLHVLLSVFKQGIQNEFQRNE